MRVVLEGGAAVRASLRRRLAPAATAALSMLWLAAAGSTAVNAAVVEYELTLAQQQVDITGTPVAAMTVNGGIPGPTLRFTEGDLARIHVRNEMKVDSSIHWHGILVPPGMDGVPYLASAPIAPGTTFTYEFPIRQSGTYWYHSHTHFQEQRGVYGSIVIAPAGGEADASDRDHVVLLSDWTDTDPHHVMRTLRRGSEWYALEKGSSQSILGAARLGKLGDYFQRELQRMPAMDIADVAYDRFLANGRPESTLEALAGETVRLRLIDGSATTFFHVQFAGGPMTVITADGVPVEPFELDRLLISTAETYDVLVRVPPGGSYELRATAHDASGYASVWLGAGERHAAAEVPYPNLYTAMGGMTARQIFALTPAGAMGMPQREVDAGKFDQPGMNMAGHGSMDHGSMDHGSMDHGSMDHGKADDDSMDHGSVDHGKTDDSSMDHSSMDHSSMSHGSVDHGEMDHANMNHAAMADGASSDSVIGSPQTLDRGGKGYGRSFGWLAADLASRQPLAEDGMGAERPWPPYARLRARAPTAFAAGKPIREVRLALDEDMERYVWFLNGKPLSASDEIEIKEGEVVRFIMVNRTMMHHPMHLHGHFFRVINGQGDFAPLKHTVDVEPMSTTVIEFDANEKGDWFFHCHLLYHMMSGMARVVSYQGFVPPPEVQAIRSGLYDEHDSWFSFGEAELMSHMSLGRLETSNSQNIVRAQWEIGWARVPDTETEIVLTYDRYVNRFFTYFVGLDVEGVEGEVEDPRAVFGVRYLLPLNVESRLWVDSDGEARILLDKMFHLSPRLGLMTEVEYDTLTDWEGVARLSYTLMQRIDLQVQWHSDYGLGGGLALRF